MYIDRKNYSDEKFPQVLINRFIANNEFNPFQAIRAHDEGVERLSRKFRGEAMLCGILLLMAAYALSSFIYADKYPLMKVFARVLWFIIAADLGRALWREYKQGTKELEVKWGERYRKSVAFLDALQKLVEIHKDRDLRDLSVNELHHMAQHNLAMSVAGMCGALRKGVSSPKEFRIRCKANFWMCFGCYLGLHLIEGQCDKLWDQLEQRYKGA